MRFVRAIGTVMLSSLCATSSAFIMPPFKNEATTFSTAQFAFWRHFVPRDKRMGLIVESTDIYSGEKAVFSPSIVMLLSFMLALPLACNAVSGGGLDYANIDITGQDFSHQNYKGKDFTQVIAKGTNFAGSNLQGCRFYKAFLVNTDFTGADLRGASLEDTSMDGASLKDANAAGAYFSASLLDAKSLENGDFTDAALPVKTQILVCGRDDVKGTNPVTGVDTRDSLMCP